MKRYLSFIILLLGICCVMSKDLIEDETTHDELNVETVQNFTSNHITVESEMETNKTVTAVLGQGRELAQGRTFAIKRLQFMLLPVMYKLGVMSTLLVALVVISLKSLLIGVILLVMKIGGIIAKLKTPYHESPSSPAAYSWPQPWPHQQPQPVHIHVHNMGEKHHPQDYSLQYQVPSGWDRSSLSNPYEKPIAIDNYGQYIFKG